MKGNAKLGVQLGGVVRKLESDTIHATPQELNDMQIMLTVMRGQSNNIPPTLLAFISKNNKKIVKVLQRAYTSIEELKKLYAEKTEKGEVIYWDSAAITATRDEEGKYFNIETNEPLDVATTKKMTVKVEGDKQQEFNEKYGALWTTPLEVHVERINPDFLEEQGVQIPTTYQDNRFKNEKGEVQKMSCNIDAFYEYLLIDNNKEE